MYRLTALLLITVIPLWSHSLEVSFKDTPFETSSTIRGSVRNVSGYSILVDVNILGFAFDPKGIFMGHAQSTIRGPIPTEDASTFSLRIDVDYQKVEKFYLQFEAGGNVLSYELKDGPRLDLWPSTPHFTQETSAEISALTRSRQQQDTIVSPKECELLVVGMASDQSPASRGYQNLIINGRLRKISGSPLGGLFSEPQIRITVYDSVGAYLQEESKKMMDCVGLSEGAECAFSIKLRFPIHAHSHKVDFMSSDGMKIPHCLR